MNDKTSLSGATTLRPIDIEKLAEEHLTPFARTGWTAYGEQLKRFAETLLEDKEREIIERCAKVCDEIVIENPGRADLTVDQCAKTIRALKHTS